MPVPDGQADRTIDYEQAGPTVVRMLLGARLRKLRESSRISREDAGDAIRASASKITRLELGRTGCKPRDIDDLLDLYGASQDERDGLLVMAGHANAQDWWQAYSEVIPGWFAPYLGLEQAAEIIRCYEVQFIPGLLQIPEYARSVLAIGADGDHGPDISQRVEVRLRRQQILRQPCPPRLWAVIDEAALRRPIGGARVARAQILHLIEMNRLSHVNIQIAPFSSGGEAIADGPITMLRFAEAELPDMVYLEQHTSATCLSRPAERLYYWDILNRLATEAPPPSDAEALLREILRDT